MAGKEGWEVRQAYLMFLIDQLLPSAGSSAMSETAKRGKLRRVKIGYDVASD